MKIRTYGEIWQDFRTKFLRDNVSEYELRRIHIKWKKLGRQA